MTETQPEANEQQPAAEPGSEKPKKRKALKSLRRAVGSKVLEKSTEIAQSLVDSTLKGNPNSARIVVALVDKRIKKKELKKVVEGKCTHSVAINLAEDDPYEDPVEDFFGPPEDDRPQPKN
jgi:hypothetical protein